MNLQGTFRWLLTVLASVVSVAIMPTVTKGDSVDYTLEAMGTVVGAFSWSVSTPSFISSTTNFTSFFSTIPPSGCAISGATVNDPQSSDVFIETFFSPACGGFTEVAQDFFGAGPVNHAGTFVPEGVPGWTLIVTTTVPEPSSVLLLGIGLLCCMAGMGFRLSVGEAKG